jgi:DNA-binding transcriptional ArsR family regulator
LHLRSGPSNLDFLERSETRKTLLSHLVGSSRTPSELASIEKKHVSHVSRALAELRSRGLVEYSESGSRERYYRVTKEGYVAFAALMSRAR